MHVESRRPVFTSCKKFPADNGHENLAPAKSVSLFRAGMFADQFGIVIAKRRE
jgi:hypothetical protein